MTHTHTPPRHVGVWLEWPAGDVSNAGALARRLAFLEVGAAATKTCILHVAVPNDLAGVIQARLTEIAGPEGEDWVLHSPARLSIQMAHEAVLTASEAAEAAARTAATAADGATQARSAAQAAKLDADELTAKAQAEAKAAARPIGSLSIPGPRGPKDVIMPWRYAARERERQVELGRLWSQEQDRQADRDREQRVADERVRAAQARVAEAEQGAQAAHLEALAAQQAAQQAAAAVTAEIRPTTDLTPAEFAEALSDRLHIDGWLVMAPDYSAATRLRGPKAVIFGDGTPAGWPLGWADSDWEAGGPAALWRARSAELLAQGNPIIVATAALAQGLGLPPDRVRIAPPAPVDLSGHAHGGEEDVEAGWAQLRAEVADAPQRYLHDFPFRDVRYLVMLSEGVPGQNLQVLARAMRLLIQRDLVPIKAFVSTPAGAPESEIWHEVVAQGLHHDLVPMPGLSTAGLAALLRGAALGVYTAPSAGGGALIAWSQTVSLGAPCLICAGPDVSACLSDARLQDFVFDDDNPEALATLIKAALADRASFAARQQAVLQDMKRSWTEVFNDHLAAIGLGAGA